MSRQPNAGGDVQGGVGSISAKRYVPAKRRYMTWVEYQVLRRSISPRMRMQEWSMLVGRVRAPAARWYEDSEWGEWVKLSWRECCRRWWHEYIGETRILYEWFVGLEPVRSRGG